MKITLVAAIASNNVIGKENSLPWNIPEDLKRFKYIKRLLNRYIENNNLEEDTSVSATSENNEGEYTPKLFSDDQIKDNTETDIFEEQRPSEQLFDQDTNEEEDFEIPAFLRRQKF